MKALNEWDGVGDPKDSIWIKHKGRIEYSNSQSQNKCNE